MGVMSRTWEPPASWLEAYEAQATPDLIERITRYADNRARLMGRSESGDDLASAALLDTLAGIVTWDPDRVSFFKHLQDVIDYRTRHRALRDEKRPHYSLDADTDDHSTDGRAIEAEAVISFERGRRVEDGEHATHARRVVEKLSPAIANRPAAQQLLRAYAQGVTQPMEVMKLTGMSAATIKNEKRRLTRLAHNLPDDVRQPALEALR
jgi:hypothetical protein